MTSVSIAPNKAAQHFGWIADLLGLDTPASRARHDVAEPAPEAAQAA